MTPPLYWWAALAVTGIVVVLLATDPVKRETWPRVGASIVGAIAALVGVGGMVAQLWF